MRALVRLVGTNTDEGAELQGLIAITDYQLRKQRNIDEQIRQKVEEARSHE